MWIKRIFFLLLWLALSFFTGYYFWFFTNNNRPVYFEGNIDRLYQNGSTCTFYIGRVVARVDGDCRLKKGLKVRVVGKIKTSLISSLRGEIDLRVETIDTISSSSFRETLWMKFQSSVFKFRDYCVDIYKKYLPDRESALLSGIVFGSKSDIGYDFYEEMVRSGTIHIAVASGFNLMLMYGFLTSLLYWFFDKKYVALFCSVTLFIYAVMAGMEPPIVRAWLMIVVLIWSQVIGRKLQGWWVLIVSIWVMLVWDIGLIINVSFQLSVASSFALIVLVPLTKEYFVRKSLEREFELLEKMEVVTTILATAVTLPIIAWHFGRVNLWGVISNIFVLPLVPPLMILGLLMVVLPQILFAPVYILAHTVVILIGFFGS